MHRMIVRFDTDGVRAMHRDSFNLGFLGPQEIKRASDIRFNEATQTWDLWVPQYRHMPDSFVCRHDAQRGFSGYEVARRVEVEWMDECLSIGCRPVSVAGLGALMGIRVRDSV